MVKLDHRTQILLLVALAASANASPVLAQADAKSSKPLNLLSFAQTSRATGVHKPRPPAAPLPSNNAPVRATAWAAEDAAPLITGAVPAPDASPPAGRAAKAGSVTVPPRAASPTASASEEDVALFCKNVADPAADARLAWQLKELEKAENQLRERIAEVEAKRAEYEKWMALRDEFLKKAEASMVDIYSRMRPEAAALQIAGMADEAAAAVLAKLSPRNSSAIFNEMDSARAAHLADLLSGMRRVDDGKTSK